MCKLRLCELKEKEVINICNCKRLGFVSDIIFEEKCGKIIALIVPGPPKLWGMFCKDMEYIIGWNQIRQIGPDIILVEIDEEECFKKCSC